jgi:hypothetical protein
MILDDIEVPGNSMTELMREKLLQLCTEVESILTPKDDARILFLGTPQTTFTVYRKLAERAYRPFVWPARYPKKPPIMRGYWRPNYRRILMVVRWHGMVTDPDRFDDEDLVEREASMGRSNFMLQFMLDTSLSDAEKFPLKCADLIVTSVNPSTAPESVIWCSDPQNLIKDLPIVGLPGDYFYSPMQLQGNWEPTPKQSAVLIRRVVAQMKQQQLLSPNETVSCTCTTCVLTETGTPTKHYLIF